MKLKTILFEKKANRAVITLDRPDVLNAINGQVLDELETVLNDCNKDPEIRVILLQAAGGKAFCAGIDVEYVKDMSPLESRNIGVRLHDVFYLCRTLSKVILVVVNGLCL